MTSNTPEQSSGNKKFWARFICYTCGIWLVVALFYVFLAMKRDYGMSMGIPDIPALPLYAFSPHNPGALWYGRQPPSEPVFGSLEAMKQAHRWAICTGVILLILVVRALRRRSLATAIVMFLFLGLLSAIGLYRALVWAEELD